MDAIEPIEFASIGFDPFLRRITPYKFNRPIDVGHAVDALNGSQARAIPLWEEKNGVTSKHLRTPLGFHQNQVAGFPRPTPEKARPPAVKFATANR